MSIDRTERYVSLLLLTLAGVLLFLRSSPESSLQALDNPFFDLGVRWFFDDPPPVDDVTVVVVDDESLERLQQRWPMDRTHWARFVRAASAHAPAAIGLDAWFESPAPRSDVELAMDLSDSIRTGPLAEDFRAAFLLSQLDEITVSRDGDRQLAEAVAENGRVVLGVGCPPRAADSFESEPPVPLPLLGDATAARRQFRRCLPQEGFDVSASIGQIAMSARLQAGLMVGFDNDGVIRRYPYTFGTSRGVHPSLALAVATVGRPDRAAELERRALERGSVPGLLYYRLSSGIRTVRFSDVIDAPPESAALDAAFRDKLVLVGVSAQGAEDLRSTTLEADIPGVYAHANAIANLLHGTLIRTDGSGVLALSVGAFLFLVLTGWMMLRAHQPALIVALPFLFSGLWSVAFVAALKAGILAPMVPILAANGAFLGSKALFQFRRLQLERRRAATIQAAFQQYLAPDVVKSLIEHPELLRLGGTRRIITAFFSDVAGFTTISESLDPQVLVQLLNECLGSMTDIIIEEGGTIDKYIGDAVVAIFGAPLDQPDHATRACRAALRCQVKLAELKPLWIARGMPEVVVRIGLNSGPAVVGNMGSEKRFDYTMLGDTVNLAARLEGANKAYDSLILIGGKTHEYADPSILRRETDLLQVKGKTQGVSVFQPVAMVGAATDVDKARCTEFERALALYRAQRWDDAQAVFQSLADTHDDGTARVFVERIGHMREHPPGQGWDGTYELKTK